ncbi:MAG: Uma2 family endonuclease, partial [Cyanobacteria bacterium J06642_3]
MVTSVKWSVEDYHLMLSSGVLNNRAVELIAGEIIEVSPESPLHRFTNDSVAEYLRTLLQGQAKVFESHPITLANSEPEPDISIVRLPNTNYLNRHPYPEDIYWLVEISSTTLEYDLNQKKQIYAEAGIEEYWVVDLNHTELIVFREASGRDYKTKFPLDQGV